MAQRQLGKLNCHVVDGLSSGAQPSIAVVLCHGYGAPADDLAPIGAELLQTDPAIRSGVRFYFPAAVLDLGPAGLPGGRAWWPLDMERLVMAAQTGRWDEMRRQAPPGLDLARERMMGLIADIRRETGLPLARIVLGGFSQGAMLSADVALRLEEPVATVCLASGVLLAEPEWKVLAAKQAPLDVLMSHGTQDPILPFFGAEALRDLLIAHGHKVEFLPFSGGHTIPWPILGALAKRLVRLAQNAAGDEC
ncbi:MAG: phospholipase [Planctomycetaceae bacterium]|nr:phospholipase [Planctomycetaceae bacterium]